MNKQMILILLIFILAISVLVTVLFLKNDGIDEINKTNYMVKINNGEKATVNGVEIEVKEIRHKQTVEGGEAGIVVISLKDGEFIDEFTLYDYNDRYPLGNQISWRKNVFTLVSSNYVDYITMEIEPLKYGKEFNLETGKPVFFEDGLEVVAEEWLYNMDKNEIQASFILRIGDKSEQITINSTDKTSGEALDRTVTFISDPGNGTIRVKIDK